MRILLAAGVLLLLIVGAIWLFANYEASARPPQQDAPTAAEPAVPAAAAAPVAEAAPTESAPDVDAAVERTAVEVTAPPRPEHTLRGRAVDAAGQPVAGIDVKLIGWGGNSQRVEAWNKSNPPPERVNKKITTAADGVFTFRFWPPPPFHFSLDIFGPTIVRWSQTWSELEPGATTDVGDVKLERGTLVRGRVVDAAGAPVPKAEVRIEGVNRRTGDDGYQRRSTERTGGDGTFAARSALIAGEYTIDVREHLVERPEKVVLTGEPEQEIEIVLKRIDPSESVSGVVVDESGAPIRDVSVHTAQGGWTITTDVEGRFRVLKSEGAENEVWLSVMKRGYEPAAEPETYAWGRHDVRIVMLRGNGLSVLVVRADDGQPVEDYVLRVVPIDGNRFGSMDYAAHGKAPHEGGRAIAEGLRVGRHRVFVAPRSPDLAIGVVPIDMGPNGAAPVTVRLAKAAPRVVHVESAGGEPVPGARVQLLDLLGEPWSEGVPVLTLPPTSFSTGPQTLELASAATDANGDCTLPVPGDRPLALLLPGPGHAPLTLPSVTFPATGPLVVTVSRGAVLRGKLGPDVAFAELKRLAGMDGASDSKWMWPSVRLSRVEGNNSVEFPDRSVPNTVKADGSFELVGVPPGRWNVVVQYFRRVEQASVGRQEPAGTVDLVDGEVTTIAPDLSGLLPGTLEARVFHNGAPLAGTLVYLERAGAQQTEDSATTDAEGTFRAAVRAGDYRIVWMPQTGNGTSALLRSLETATVRVGEAARQTFTIVSATVKVKLVDANGAPVAGVTIWLDDAAAEWPRSLPATGADGRAEVVLEPASFTAWVFPKRLQDRKAMNDLVRTSGGPQASVRARVQLGPVTVRAGEANEFELKLPADW